MNDEILGEAEVAKITSLSRSTRWRGERAGWFPRRRQISPNRVGWLKSEIAAWLEERAAKSRSGIKAPQAQVA
ncbi:MAG: AlpA family phage regulatory protein [Rhodospirillaceae bacterium]|nr:MAG: AlpA family phage regulatory protein [Rhodospirillaceae bacterium]